MRIRTLTTSAAAVTVALGTVAAVVVTQSGVESNAAPVAATAKKPAAPGDFNGDGYADVADGSPYGKIKGTRPTGFVTVVYGGPKGASAGRRQIVTSPDKEGLLFGLALASADLDRDGYADLVVSKGGGPGRVIYGGAKGLTSRTVTLPGGSFRNAAAGDLDGNGVADLVTTREGDVHLYLNPGARPGAPQVTRLPLPPNPDPGAPGGPEDNSVRPLIGDFNGDRRTDLLLVQSYRIAFDLTESKLVVRLGTGKGLGPAKATSQPSTEAVPSALVRAGDVNGDGRTDLVHTADANGSNTRAFAVRLGTASGFAKPHYVSLKSFGSAVKGAYTGYALAVGDVDGDGRAEVAVNLNKGKGGTRGGVVLLVRGTRTGPSTKLFQVFGQDSKGVPGTDEKGDEFGGGLAFRDVNRDRRADLVVGVPREDKNEGRLYVFPGTAGGGVTTKGVVNIGTSALGVAGSTASLGGNLLF
ncbi:VCBS repeat-containing protein [Actinomadura kijaniata]|uniref:VCBS repeat-containing protein n=1 Tax=Actinomadura kijaniata TaxID=46161 RepID=UPI00082F3C75|nr:FG-GAP and VCBS repeat-containing protein [Actinomadura kijaniata]